MQLVWSTHPTKDWLDEHSLQNGLQSMWNQILMTQTFAKVWLILAMGSLAVLQLQTGVIVSLSFLSSFLHPIFLKIILEEV
jgi:hypothetical protein